jgi:methylated-DNA-protein-cysteine methyltransferase-like protein
VLFYHRIDRCSTLLMKKTTNTTISFFHDVYDVVKLIPSGKVSTYGAIARYLGTMKSARMVGWAMNASHQLNDVPAHRVLNRNGVLTGKFHFATPCEMQRLLESEGIRVVNDQVQDFSNVFWDPNKALKFQ